MKRFTKLKIKIVANVLAGLGCSLGVVVNENLIIKGFFILLGILAFSMAYADFEKYPTED